MDSLYNEKGQWPVPLMVRRKNIHAVFCESNYFPKGKFKLSNSFFHSECTLLFFNTFDFYCQFVCHALSVGPRINACIRSPAKNPASLEKAGQARLSAFLARLTRKRRPGKAWQAWPQPRFLGNLGHQSLAYLALLLPRPSFLGNPGQKSPA